MYIPGHQSTQSTRHFYMLFFRNYRIICHTLKIFIMSRQLNSVTGMSLFVKVWIIVLRPLWFFTLGSSPAFSATFFINEFSLFTPTADFFNHGLGESCFLQLFTAR